jgi:hypothetical protein
MRTAEFANGCRSVKESGVRDCPAREIAAVPNVSPRAFSFLQLPWLNTGWPMHNKPTADITANRCRIFVV